MKLRVWPITAIILIVFVYLTKAVLSPFLAGLAVAYLLDPVADKLEARKIPRGIAAALVIGFFFTIIAGLILALVPVLQAQFSAFSTSLPETLSGLRPWLNETLASLSEQFGVDIASDAEGVLASFSDDILSRLQATAGSIIQNGLAFFNLLTLLLISPVVAFYLLRDWDLLVAKVDSWLPASIETTVREQVSKIDEVLAGFVRGQVLVCLIMGVLYAVGWSIVGLNFGLVLGVLAGIMAFVPFVGVFFALAVAIILGVGQWGLDFQNLGLVTLVFLIVQIVEGVFLTPRLVGERVGLHPVWVLFAVFAGGEVMGFVGVLIAVPAAAAIAVLVRYFIEMYLEKDALDQRNTTAAGDIVIEPTKDGQETENTSDAESKN